MVISDMKKRCLVALFLVLLFIAGYVLTGCGRVQYVNPAYNFAIAAKKGEVLKNVTLYLPFPTDKDGKPLMEIYKSLVKDHKNDASKRFPNSAISLINTKHGPMLKVTVPEISDYSSFVLSGGYSFEEPFSKESNGPRFPINPRLNPRKPGKNEPEYLFDSYIYTKFDNANELELSLEYKVGEQSPSLLPLDYVPEDNYYVHLGLDHIPQESYGNFKLYKSAGWQKVLAIDIGYDNEEE